MLVCFSMDLWNSGIDKASVLDLLADVVKALANGRRLELLAQGEHSVETGARTAGMALTTTSAHLQTCK